MVAYRPTREMKKRKALYYTFSTYGIILTFSVVLYILITFDVFSTEASCFLCFEF